MQICLFVNAQMPRQKVLTRGDILTQCRQVLLQKSLGLNNLFLPILERMSTKRLRKENGQKMKQKKYFPILQQQQMGWSSCYNTSMTAREIIDIYISFFEKRGHKRIPGAPLVPDNDPTTLFTSSGMQPLLPYLLGEEHPQGKRLVDVQNVFRAVDIEEVGDDRHTTFYRMLGNWSLGDYFKTEQLPWVFEFLTKELRLNPHKLYVTVFAGNNDVPKDEESIRIWKKLFVTVDIDAKEGERIMLYGVEKNWWSRSGTPDKMPPGEPGGPDSELFYDFGSELNLHENSPWKNDKCHVNCDCGRYWEIGNSVFIQYIKNVDGNFKLLPQQNVDFGGGLERLIGATENQPDMFLTSLFKPTIEQIAKQYKDTDEVLVEKFEEIALTIETEKQQYEKTLTNAKRQIERELRDVLPGIKEGDELMGSVEISAEVAFKAISSFGLSPTQLKSLGYTFNIEELAEKIKEHKNLSRTASAGKFKGGLADAEELTVKGHTATHLLHQAIRDMLGRTVHQTGSNITVERLRFDFNYDKKLTDEQINELGQTVSEKIKEDLPVHFEMMSVKAAKEMGAIGLFDEKYQEQVKVYSIGEYSKELCGGPHVPHTGVIKSFTITKQESIGKGQQRIYAKVA